MKYKTVNILGTKYSIEFRSPSDDEMLNNCDGYSDVTIKLIVVDDFKNFTGTVKDTERYQKEILRHEITHAFLYESGLAHSSHKHSESWAVDEEIVDWFAIQSPKILKAFQEVGCV